MKIKKLKVKNFRCWQDSEFVFSDSGALMVFWGANGSGKSSILEACQLALGMDVRRQPPKGQKYSIDLVAQLSDGREVTIHKTPDGHYAVCGNAKMFGLPIRMEPIRSDCNPFAFDPWRVPERQESVNMTLGGTRQLAKKANNALVRLQSYAINLKGIGNVTGADEDAKAVDAFFQKLADAWRLFYPDGDYRFSIRTAASAWRGEAGRSDVSEGLNLFLEDAKEKTSVPVNELSSGEIEVLGMLGALLIESKPYDIVFIDEPELHLNPIWYGVLTRALRTISPTTQFVIGTNAVDIWRAAYSDERIALKAHGEGVETETDVS